MDEKQRKDQLEKIQSMINKKGVSRRSFFGSLGKIAVLSQIAALGAVNFIASCVAVEDKAKLISDLKTTCTDASFWCLTGYDCQGNFDCYVSPDGFTCNPSGQSGFNCVPSHNGDFACNPKFACGSADYFTCTPQAQFICTGSFTMPHAGGG